ncbi:hypothetical protein HKX48_001564 [Thoreauomyces humboldtii]|nr:hypothetical protein HKX48_001564 [Thoreauomyces humboldtii]
MVISTRATSGIKPRVLYIDIMSFGDHFFFVKDLHWTWQAALTRLRNFFAFLRNSDWVPKVLLAAASASKQTIKKWQFSRTIDLQRGERTMPQGIKTMIVELCHDCEFSHERAWILSPVRALLDYTDARFRRVYDGFVMDYTKERVNLIDAVRTSAEQRIRTLLPILPDLSKTDPSRSVDGTTNLYMRGVPSVLTKELGNPQITVRPLRQAL